MRVLKIADWSKTPGPRDRATGKFSADEFFEDVFEPAFAAALATEGDDNLTLDMDGCAGFASSWLDQLAGRIAETFYREDVEDCLVIINTEEPYLVGDLEGLIKERFEEIGE